MERAGKKSVAYLSTTVVAFVGVFVVLLRLDYFVVFCDTVRQYGAYFAYF